MNWTQAAATICFKPFPLDEALHGLVEAGFTHVELCAVKDIIEHVDPDDLSSAALRAVERSLDNAGVKAVSFSGHTQLHTDDGVARMKRLLDAASHLGMVGVNTFTGDAHTPEEHAAFLRNVKVLGDYAAERDVYLLLETDSEMLPTGVVASWLLPQVDHPAVKLNYDPGNVAYLAGTAPEEDVVHALPFIGHVHIKDQRGWKGVHDYPPMGEGDLNLSAILGAIHGSGFEGVFSMEVAYDDVTWPDWDTCLADTRRSKAHWDAIEQSALTRA
jgi:L-ribulose-5-phosphate 3-epimerase